MSAGHPTRYVGYAVEIAFALLLGVSPASGQQAYQEIVALQKRALGAVPTRVGDAIRDHLESIRIGQDLGRPRLLAVLFWRLGEALQSAGLIQDAVIAYERGLRALTADKQINLLDEFNSLSSVGKSYGGHRGNPVPADLYSESLAQDLAEAETDPALPVSLLLGIGNAYLRQPQPDPALNAYRQALGREETKKAPKLRAYALANAGEALRLKGEVDEAERDLTEALDLLKQHVRPVDRRRALALLAGIHRDRGRADRALSEYTEALALYQQEPDPQGEGRAQAGLGRLHLEARRFDEARVAYRRAVDLGKQVNDQDSLWHAYWGLGQALAATGDLVGASASLEQSLTLIQARQGNLRTDEGKVGFLDSAQDVFDQLIQVHVSRARSNPAEYGAALQVAERARAGAMHDLMGVSYLRRGLDCPATQPSPRLDAHSRDEARSGQPSDMARQQAPGTPSGPEQAAPHIRSGQTEDDRARVYPDPRCGEGRSTTPVSPPALTRLVFHVLGESTAVFSVSPAGAVVGFVAPLGRKALTLRVQQLRERLGVDASGRGVTATSSAAAPADFRPVLRELYETLIAPVENGLPTGETIVIEPHGPLWLLPFAALITGDGAFLVDRWPILYAPSAQILDEIRKEPAYNRPADLKALIIGNPTPPGLTVQDDERFRGTRLRDVFQPLPGAEQEARSVAASLLPSQSKLLIGPEADLATVEALTREYNVIHLASHALAFAESPLDSFVMLAPSSANDGRLTARRVLNMSLATDLVTLSACQTGLGQLSGDGVIGLSRAFLVRGARSVVVSQWSVSDSATAALMSSFYSTYARGAEDKARALQLAMKEVRGQPGREHPRYWAPFVLIGSER